METKLMEKALERIAKYKGSAQKPGNRSYRLASNAFRSLHNPKDPNYKFDIRWVDVDFETETITSHGELDDYRGGSFGHEAKVISWSEIGRLEDEIVNDLIRIEEQIDKEEEARQKKIAEENRRGQLKNRALDLLWKELK